MKYNININQLALNEIAPDLNIIDAAILDYLIVICNSKNEKIEEQRIKEQDESWTWIDMGSLLKDMPLLDFSSRSSLTPRFKKIAKSGLIHLKIKRVSGHKRLFIKLDKLIENLFTKLDRPIHQTGQAIEKPIHQTGPIINTSKLDTYTNKSLEKFFIEFWSIYPKKIAKDYCYKKWLKLTPELASQIIENVKIRKVQDKTWLAGYAPNPSTYLNQKRWEDEIITYTPNKLGDTPYKQGKYSDIKVRTIDNVIKPKDE